MPTLSASEHQYVVSPTWTAVDFGLNSQLDTDDQTVTTDTTYAPYYATTPPGVGRPPEQRTNIASAWAARKTLPHQIGQGATDFIGLMNLVGISVGDVSVAAGVSTSDVRSYLLSNTFWTPLDTSSKDIYWAQMRGSPVGTFEIGVGGGEFYITNSAYLHFFTAAPYATRSYTATWTLSRFFTSGIQYVGAVQTISINKSYNICTISSLGGILAHGGNVYFDEKMWPWYPLPAGETIYDGGAAVVLSGPGDTDYMWKWQAVGGTNIQWNGDADATSASGFGVFGYMPPIPTYQYQLWNADGDFAIGSPRTSNTSYIPSGFVVGGGGGVGGATGLVVTTAVPTKTVVKSTATSFTPIVASGGTSPYHYTITPALPAGLTINESTGTISGTPSVVSTATVYTVNITDTAIVQVTGTFTLTVAAQSNLNTNDLTSITNTLGTLAETLTTIVGTLQTAATNTGVSGVNTAVAGVSTAVSGNTTTLAYIKNFLDNMPDYTTQLNNLVTALQTIATNSTTDATNLATVATKLGSISLEGASIQVDVGDIDASLATVASKLTDIETYQKRLKELGESTGIHMRGPYEAIGFITMYRMLIEQAKLIDHTEFAAPSERERAMTALAEYVEKIKPLSEF
jgi:hypothetical protein